jgi:hypothetical protein
VLHEAERRAAGEDDVLARLRGDGQRAEEEERERRMDKRDILPKRTALKKEIVAA